MMNTYGVAGDTKERHDGGTALAVYTAMPMMLAGVALLYPHLWLVVSIFVIAACYSIYLTYEGIPILMNIPPERGLDRKSTRLNSSHVAISYAVFCLKNKR